MADFGLFLGFGNPIRGREVAASKVFGEVMAFYGDLQRRGEIDGFEVAILEPHGGDLGGFFLVRGEAQKLAAIRASAEFQRLLLRGQAVVEHVGLVSAMLDSEAGRFVSTATEITADLRG